MSQELRSPEMEIARALRTIKFDPKTFKDEVEKSLNAAGLHLSNHLNRVRQLFEGHYDETIEELEKVQFKLLSWPRRILPPRCGVHQIRFELVDMLC